MLGEPERTALSSPEPNYQCSLCKKTFGKDNQSLRGSGTITIAVRSFLTRTSPVGDPAAAVCNERGINCEYGVPTRPVNFPTRRSLPITPRVTPEGADGPKLEQSTGDSIFTGDLDSLKPMHPATSTQGYLRGAVPPGSSLENGRGADIDNTDTLGLEFQPSGMEDSNFLSSGAYRISTMFGSGASFLGPMTMQLSPPSPFDTPAPTKPSHAPLITLAMRMLESYPLVALQKRIFPPFISPIQCSWIETGQGPRQQNKRLANRLLIKQALANCVGLIHMFRSRTESSRTMLWRMISLEQERILAELISCTLTSSFEEMIKGICEGNFLKDPSLEWRDWVFIEARRRTVLVFQVMEILVKLSSNVSYFPTRTNEAVLIPLAGSAIAWNAPDMQSWKRNFKLSHKPNTMYGLSAAGELACFRKDDTGTHYSVEEWAEWNAEVGEIGSLVMIASALL
ncbi:hypothetical protein BX600DRAFT_502611 [Xylariales sp. PMI_506]|nr:hypothetical protein BX600DRAFT_502611 [Xylariales sp. PMI_506]